MDSSTSEHDLIEACKKQNDAAFGELYRRYSGEIYALLLRSCSLKADAEEVAQEVFLSIYKTLPRFRHESSFRTWAYRIALRRVADWYRKKGNISAHRISLFENETEHEPVHQQEQPGPREFSARKQQEERMEQALRQVQEPYRTALVLRYLQDMDYQQIADIMECRLGTIKSRINRGHTMLEDVLNRMGLGE